MINNSQEFSKFDAACGEMAASKYILAEKKIAGILGAIAASEKLTAIVGKCTADFDFGAAFVSAKASDARGRTILRTLGDRKDAIAFVFCLLMEVDAGKRNFIDFLSGYYSEDDMHDGYKAFCAEQIIPFAHNVRLVLEGGDVLLNDPVEEVSSNERKADPQKKTEKPKQFNNIGLKMNDNGERLTYDMVRDLLECTQAISDDVASNPSLQPYERDELIILLDALSSAIQTRNIGYIKILFIGAKNTAACISASKNLFPHFQNLFGMLKGSGVL